MSLWEKFKNDPTFMKKLNGWLAIGWLVAAFPICIFLSQSIPLLVFISVYAIVASHWSSWVAGRVEVIAEQSEDGLTQEDREWIKREVLKDK